MKKITLFALSGLLLTGCSSNLTQPSMSISDIAPTPICRSDKQCQAMWAEVPRTISTASGMKVKSFSEAMIDTYPPNRRIAPNLYGMAIKKPLPAGGYMISASFSCGGAHCQNQEIAALDFFNKIIALTGKEFEGK